MLGAVPLMLIGSLEVGRKTFRRAGEVCPAYGLDVFGTGAQR